MRIASILIFLLLITGCAKTIDGSSDESFRASIADLLADIPKDQHASLFYGSKAICELEGLSEDGQPIAGHRTDREILNGMSAEEIIKNGKIAGIKVALRNAKYKYGMFKKIYDEEEIVFKLKGDDGTGTHKQTKGWVDEYANRVNALEKQLADAD